MTPFPLNIQVGLRSQPYRLPWRHEQAFPERATRGLPEQCCKLGDKDVKRVSPPQRKTNLSPGDDMAGYGICTSTEERCGLSAFSPNTDQLIQRVRVIQEHGKTGHDVTRLVEHLGAYRQLYQTGTTCAQCGGGLFLLTQPTANLNEQEARTVEHLNSMLMLADTLVAMGVLPVKNHGR